MKSGAEHNPKPHEVPLGRVTPDEIKALRQSIDGWMEVYNTTGNGAYFTVGWARGHLASLLAKMEKMAAL